MTDVIIPAGEVELNGILQIPENAKSIVLFAHGSGSSRFSLRNQFVANVLNAAHQATLLFDLLTPDEEIADDVTREFRFNIDFLAERLIYTIEWLSQQTETKSLSVGIFGASTGGAAALVAAAKKPQVVKAVVSRGGRPDLAGTALPEVKSPALLIVGGNDDVVIQLNEAAYEKLSCTKELKIIPGATHLFEEPGTLEQVASLAQKWFVTYL